MRSTFTDRREEAIAIIDKLESVLTNLYSQIEFSEEIPEQEYYHIEKYINEVDAVVEEIKEHINFSN